MLKYLKLVALLQYLISDSFVEGVLLCPFIMMFIGWINFCTCLGSGADPFYSQHYLDMSETEEMTASCWSDRPGPVCYFLI